MTETDLWQQCNNYFVNNGLVANTLSNFVEREGQKKVAKNICTLLTKPKDNDNGKDNGKGIAVIEAGPGIGKTFSYLIPVLVSKQKAIISTSTKALQDQLKNDIALLSMLFPTKPDVAFLKGRDNYVCKSKLAKIDPHQSTNMFDDKQQKAFDRIYQHIHTQGFDGDISKIRKTDANAKIISLIVGCDCKSSNSEFDSCYFQLARKKAKQATIVVVNHALLVSANKLQSDAENFSILPEVDVLIIDEAHTLPELLPHAFAYTVNFSELKTKLADHKKHLSKIDDFNLAIWDEANVVVEQLANDCAQAITTESKTTRWMFKQDLLAIDSSLEEKFKLLINAITAYVLEIEQAIKKSNKSKLFAGVEIDLDRLREIVSLVKEWAIKDFLEGEIAWATKAPTGVFITKTNYQSDQLFNKYIYQQQQRIVLVSATLAIQKDLHPFMLELGINDDNNSITDVVPSPFDYKRNAMLYLPTKLPNPNSENFVEKLVDIACELIEHINGRTLILFTSIKNLKQASKLFKQQLPDDITVLTQGEQLGPHVMVNTFQKAQGNNYVLLGTKTFTQGIDIRGQALSLLMIDKFPIGHIDDPIKQALAEEFGNNHVFVNIAVPRATTALNQSIGRLIRSETDTGVVVFFDSRATSKDYRTNWAKRIMRSIPPMTKAKSIKEVKNFLKH